MIVKIQKAQFPPDAPTLIYDKPKTFMANMPMAQLPKEIRQALYEAPKVYWHVQLKNGRHLVFHSQAEAQAW